MCIVKLLDWENIFPHTWQQNCFSPVCVRLCMIKLADWLFFPHCWKSNCFFAVASDSSYARWIIRPCHKTILIVLHASSEFTSLVKRLQTNFACGALLRLTNNFFVTKFLLVEMMLIFSFPASEKKQIIQTQDRPLAHWTDCFQSHPSLKGALRYAY